MFLLMEKHFHWIPELRIKAMTNIRIGGEKDLTFCANRTNPLPDDGRLLNPPEESC